MSPVGLKKETNTCGLEPQSHGVKGRMLHSQYAFLFSPSGLEPESPKTTVWSLLP